MDHRLPSVLAETLPECLTAFAGQSQEVPDSTEGTLLSVPLFRDPLLGRCDLAGSQGDLWPGDHVPHGFAIIDVDLHAPFASRGCHIKLFR